MAVPSINGDWWIRKDEVRTIQDTEEIERSGRVIEILRTMKVQARQYQMITDGNDSDVRFPDVAEHWNDPVEGEPDNARDWLVSETVLNYDITTGRVSAVCSAVKMPEDWESQGVIKTRGTK
jgi:hypothetical protein